MAGYLARTRLHMGDGLHREYGEPVPEADTWLNVRTYVRQGQIERVSDREYDEAVERFEARKRAAAEQAQAEALAALASLPSVVVEPAVEDAPQPIAFPSDEVSIHVEPRAEPEPEQDASADLRSAPEPVADVLAGDAEGGEPEVEAPKHSGGKRSKRRG